VGIVKRVGRVGMVEVVKVVEVVGTKACTTNSKSNVNVRVIS
jgi:hypothetical protein